MNTNFFVYILWGVSSIRLLCAGDTQESPNKRTKKVFEPEVPKPRTRKVSITGYSSIYRTPPVRSSVSRRRAKGPNLSAGALTPRARSLEGTQAHVQPGFAYVPDVSVTCSANDFVLRVKPGFYGLGADADELRLGGTCRSTGVLRPYGDLLFTYPLTACDAVRHQSSHDYLIYKYVLHYDPSPKRLTRRAHPIEVDIECRYPRNLHVYQLSVQPTWKTAVVRKRLKGSLNNYKIELMDGSWSSPASSQVYHLGNKIHFQVSAHHLSPGEKIYINSCYAKPSRGSQSPLKYTIIDHFGCLLDSKTDPGASRFVSRTDSTLRFSLKAFQFTSDPETEVSVHCTLFASSEDPGPAQKSCTYREDSWKALTGQDSICECCDSQCETSKSRRAMMEGSVSSGSLLVSDQPIMEEEGFLPMTSVSVSRGGEASVIRLTELHTPGTVQDHDEEEQQSDRDQSRRTEPGLEDLGLEDVVEKINGTFSDVVEDYGSGGQEENEGSEEQEKEELGLMVLAEINIGTDLEPPVSEEKEKTKNESDLKARNDSQWEDVGEDGKKTWYFWK